MAWPSLNDQIPAPLRGGPLPDDVIARASRALHEAWRHHVAKRVQGAEERALALVVFPGAGRGPFGLLFDGRTLEVASADLGVTSSREGGRDLELLGLPGAGLISRHAGLAIWRESLTPDRASQLWRSFGGDEAFALPVGVGRAQPGGPEAYALIRRDADRVRLDLGDLAHAPAELLAWAQRFRSWMRADVRSSLGL